jgi:hypothetical protein
MKINDFYKNKEVDIISKIMAAVAGLLGENNRDNRRRQAGRERERERAGDGKTPDGLSEP